MTTEQNPLPEPPVPANTPDRGSEDDDRFQGYIDAAAADADTDDTHLYEPPTEVDDEPLAPVAEEEPQIPFPETPVETAPTAPVEPAPVVPNELEALRQQNEVYQQQLQQAELQRQSQLLEQQPSQMATELQNQGLMPAEAAQIAQQQTYYRQQAMQAQQQAQQYAEFQQGKMNAAFHYGQLHNVSPQELMQYNTPQEMERAAKSHTEIAALKAEVAGMKRGQVAPQSMDNNQTSPVQGSSQDRLVDSALGKPASQWSPAESEAMRTISGG